MCAYIPGYPLEPKRDAAEENEILCATKTRGHWQRQRAEHLRVEPR